MLQSEIQRRHLDGSAPIEIAVEVVEKRFSLCASLCLAGGGVYYFGSRTTVLSAGCRASVFVCQLRCLACRLLHILLDSGRPGWCSLGDCLLLLVYSLGCAVQLGTYLRSQHAPTLGVASRPVPYDVTSDTMPNLELSLVRRLLSRLVFVCVSLCRAQAPPSQPAPEIAAVCNS